MRIEKIIEELDKVYKFKPVREDPFKLLITTVLSQRTRDETTEEAVGRLFTRIKKPQDLLKMSEAEIAKLIYPVGFYRQKAKNIKRICKILVEKGIPRDREGLMELPGVGSKTAAIVLAYGFGQPAIAVDTHVNRISKRLGLVGPNSNPEDTEKVLERIVPKDKQVIVNHLLVSFGKDVCKPFRPLCFKCPIRKYCDYYKHRSG